jgi:phospholipid-binding lipoprotein MlaA
MKKLSILTAILLCLINTTYAEELLKQQSKYPDYAYIYLGDDKYEKMNRKVFAFNLGLNKYAIRPIHILWTSIMPEYGIERIQSAYKNIEYPKRLVSSFIQKDFKATGSETVRFLTNTTIGLGGLFDPAKSIFHIEPLR